MKNYSVFFFFFGKKKKANVFRRVHHFSLYERCDREGDISIAIQKIQLFSTLILRFIILITLGNRHKVFLLNENHKFSVEILKPRASSKTFLDCDQQPRLGDIVSCALHTRKEIWERSRPISTKLTGSDGSRTFLKVFGVVTLSRSSVASSISYVCLSYNSYILAVQFIFSNWKWSSKKRHFSISQLDTTKKLLWKCLGDKFK